MTKEEFDNLNVGDIIAHPRSLTWYKVLGFNNDGLPMYTLLCIANPNTYLDYELIQKAQDER